MSKSLLYIFIIVMVAIIAMLFLPGEGTYESSPSSFFECVEAGNPIMESDPRRCRSKGGDLFIENIGNEAEFIDQIIIYNPRPNQAIESPLVIEGEVIGSWFAKSNFEINLVDDGGSELATTYTNIQGDWADDQFIPFTVELKYLTGQKSGTLIFKKARGIDSTDEQLELRVPVIIK